MKTKNTFSVLAKSPSTPARGPRVMVGPGVFAALPAKNAPSTPLGTVARQLVDQATLTTLSIPATSGYVYALTDASTPQITFQDVPPGMKGTLAELQAAYNTFQTQFATFQGQAGLWVDTQPGAAASILSQLVSVSNIFTAFNASIVADFGILADIPQDSSTYQVVMTQLLAEIDAELPNVTSLSTYMAALGTELRAGAP